MAKVQLSRDEVERFFPTLLGVCVYCGAPAKCTMIKRYSYQRHPYREVGVVDLLFKAFAPDIAIRLPICERHQRAWFIWSFFYGYMPDREHLVLRGVSDEFAAAVEKWRAEPEPPSSDQEFP